MASAISGMRSIVGPDTWWSQFKIKYLTRLWSKIQLLKNPSPFVRSSVQLLKLATKDKVKLLVWYSLLLAFDNYSS